eukprot:scaffold262285_cov22-Tisochrysis_lutea.AAC.1
MPDHTLQPTCVVCPTSQATGGKDDFCCLDGPFRYSRRLYTAYTTLWVVGTMLAMQHCWYACWQGAWGCVSGESTAIKASGHAKLVCSAGLSLKSRALILSCAVGLEGQEEHRLCLKEDVPSGVTVYVHTCVFLKCNNVALKQQVDAGPLLACCAVLDNSCCFTMFDDPSGLHIASSFCCWYAL